AVRIEHGTHGTLSEHSKPHVTRDAILVFRRHYRLPRNTGSIGGDSKQNLQIVQVQHAWIGTPALSHMIADLAVLIWAGASGGSRMHDISHQKDASNHHANHPEAHRFLLRHPA